MRTPEPAGRPLTGGNYGQSFGADKTFDEDLNDRTGF